jgi:hypothetical protein
MTTTHPGRKYMASTPKGKKCGATHTEQKIVGALPAFTDGEKNSTTRCNKWPAAIENCVNFSLQTFDIGKQTGMD